MRNSPVAVSLFAVLAMLGTQRSAAAYCRTTTCDGCPQPAYGCVEEGKKLYWPVDCVSFNLQKDVTRWAPFATADLVAQNAFNHWNEVVCPGQNQPLSIVTVDRGPVECSKREYNENGVRRVCDAGVCVEEGHYGGNANIIVFRANWTQARNFDPASVLALTTVTFNRSTGEIYDADIEVNGEREVSTETPVPANSYDLESILTHEAGHFLGLAHTRAACSSGTGCPTMTAAYTTGSDTYRSLEPDDIEGICAIYPPGRVAQQSACVPNFGFSSTCGETKPPAENGGCTVARGPGSVGAAGIGWALAMLLAALVRRPSRRG